VIEVIVCRTGLSRHDPDLPARIRDAGGVLSTVECFDRCETCERALLARLDGAMTRFRSGEELASAVLALQETG
jgi:hypothetical protein